MRINKKLVAYVLADILCCAISIFLAALLRFDMSVSTASEYLSDCALYYLACSVVSVLACGAALGTYNSIYANIGFLEVLRQLLIAIISVVAFLLCHMAFDMKLSVSITLFYGFFLFASTVFVRCIEYFASRINRMRKSSKKTARRVVIVGAGRGGAMLIRMLTLRGDMNLIPVAVLDDDDRKQNMSLCGVRVRGKIADAPSVCAKVSADELIIAIPSADSALITDICEKCKDVGIPIKMFGNMVDFKNFLSGTHSALCDVSLEDLLFRDSVITDMSRVSEYINGKSILVTGGAGSIGSELCKQLLEYGCDRLVIMDINENGLFHLQNELAADYAPSRFCLRVGSVRDKVRMSHLFRRHKFDAVFHAAAHKHVPLMEENVFEAVKNNVVGTKNVLECCVEHGVRRFVLISSDKAVNPTNVMGATKRAAEILVQEYNGRGGCEMASVRFGNVLGSAGSVIPLFKRQIAAGGPVTVTHRDIKRYFMTIPEAVSLVLKCGACARGGEVFVLDMGKPISIYDLARSTISLSGLVPERDIEIKITGLRPGEKMMEELTLDDEHLIKTEHDKIFVVRTDSCPENSFSEIDGLIAMLDTDVEESELRSSLFRAISSNNA